MEEHGTFHKISCLSFIIHSFSYFLLLLHFLYLFPSTVLPTCDNSLALLYANMRQRIRPGLTSWLVCQCKHLSITLSLISASLGMAQSGCSVMGLTIQQHVHLSFADLLLIVSRVTCHNYPPAKSSEALNIRFGQIIGQDNHTTV